MPLKRHKKNMRTYENCFSSTEAIDFLHRNLQKNPNFGSDVTKEQTIQLLKKLFRAGIIENVKEDSCDEEFKVDKTFHVFLFYLAVKVVTKLYSYWNSTSILNTVHIF